MTPRDHFKLKFLKTCAEAGCSPQEALGRAQDALAYIEKQASPTVLAALLGLGKGLFGLGGKAVSTFGGPLMTAGTIGAVGLPLAAGGLGGVTAARATSDDSDIDEAKANELIAEYARLSDQSRRYNQVRQHRFVPGGTT
jgi:hypothetical protein